MKWYWLSFVDTNINKNLGCCNVEAISKEAALFKVNVLGINPGGEVLIQEMPEPEVEPNKLYSPEELVSLGYINIGEISDKSGIPVEDLPHLDYCICPDCNDEKKNSIQN